MVPQGHPAFRLMGGGGEGGGGKLWMAVGNGVSQSYRSPRVNFKKDPLGQSLDNQAGWLTRLSVYSNA